MASCGSVVFEKVQKHYLSFSLPLSNYQYLSAYSLTYVYMYISLSRSLSLCLSLCIYIYTHILCYSVYPCHSQYRKTSAYLALSFYIYIYRKKERATEIHLFKKRPLQICSCLSFCVQSACQHHRCFPRPRARIDMCI